MEAAAMGRAIELAWRGWGRVHPNPLVGAVVLAGDEVIGEGWHAEFGERHAEPVALAAAGARARGATLVVSLEPCAHQGKQPPCVDAILAAGVRRCVVATPDPHPLAQGGAERLRAAGVEVEVGLLGEAARAQNAAFLFAAARSDRPFVALKLATTVDGRIADHTGSARWVSGEAARAFVHWLRAGFDAIAVGGHTALVDDPSLTVRGRLEPRVPPVRVVFDRGLALPATHALVRTAAGLRTIVVTAEDAPPDRMAALWAAGVETMCSEGLEPALRALRNLQLRSLLVEGGGRLAGALLEAGLVDRLYWIQAPTWLGDGSVPAFAGLQPRALADAPRWRVVERRALGEDTLLVLDRP